MKMRGGDLVVKALEDEGVCFTFGIPGTHNIELYDSLDRSARITPVLVTDEQSASFMADGVSRTSDSVGVVNVVPGAGVTHCLSGVAEAFMDNVPLVILTCGIRRDTGRAYQLHDVDQLALLRPITKATLRPTRPEEIYSAVRHAFTIARSGSPGPAAVEIAAEYYMLSQDVSGPSSGGADGVVPEPTSPDLDAAAQIINASRSPALYVGNGARNATAQVLALAEMIWAPVTTTIQGKGVFPETHPLWLWNGFGASAPRFVRKVMEECDCLIAIGCRFGEVATASYGLTPPPDLIHVDINREVFNRNFPARLAIESDAAMFLKGLLPRLRPRNRNEPRKSEIAEGHRSLREERVKHGSRDKVTPAVFFEALQAAAGPGAIYATDSGNGTFLAMEHLRLQEPGCFIGPIDYSCMGYSVPAAIGAKFANPERIVVALSGDGALLMTGLELLTAASYGAAPIVCVLRDGELGQIAQFQRTSLNRDTCSVLAPYSVEAFACAANGEYLKLASDRELPGILSHAVESVRRQKPVVIEVSIDYSQKTFFTKGIISTNFWRLPWGDRIRMLARAASRHLSG